MGTTPNGAPDPETRFRALYRENVGAVLAFAVRRVPAPDDAADVAADTFLVAWRRLADVPAGGEARLWLYGVARRVLANHVRGDGRRARLGERLRTELAHHLATRDPADEVVEVRAVRAALARLPPDDREVLELTAWEELAPREIATALDLPPALVRTRLSRARARLRAELGPAGDETGSPGHVSSVRSILVPKEER